MQITAIILAGGKSKRMGTDKALVELDGITLIEKVIGVCEKVFDTILISSNKEEHKAFSYPVITDEVQDCGPIGGIYSCLKQSRTEWNFVISVDAAFINPEFINFLIAEIDDADAIVPYTQRGKEPLIALYKRSALTVMKEKVKSKDFKMHNLLKALNTKFTDAQSWEAKHPNIFHNLNSPRDLNV